jgi:hypothetical protein
MAKSIRRFPAKLLAPLGLLIAGMTPAFAIPVQWTMQNAQFSGSYVYGILSVNGSFTYDADTNVYSNVNLLASHPDFYYDIQLSTSDVSQYSDADYLSATKWSPDPVYGSGQNWLFDFVFTFATPLSNSGGTVQLTQGGYANVFVPDLNYGYIREDFYPSSTSPGVVTAVPLPASVWLFLSGLGLLLRRSLKV